MKRFNLAFLFAFIASALLAPPAFAELQPASELRKLSLHVRGRAPSAADYADLAAAAQRGGEREFLRAKARAYLATPEHAAKLSFRLEELFRLETDAQAEDAADPIIPSLPGARTVPYQRQNALNELFASIARDNLPWDTLLTGKNYVLRDLPGSIVGFTFRMSDYGFFGAVARDRLPTTVDGVVRTLIPTPLPDRVAVSFADDDPRIAGALTTPRFLQRYGNTAVNKNRRRAAAVFRIFLCDPMLAVVPPPAGALDRLLDRAFPPGSDITEGDIRALVEGRSDHGGVPPGDIHGSDKSCAVCHYKLDPVGRTFLASATVLAPAPSPGALVFRNARQETVNVPGRGIGEVAAAIARQPEYARCQVRQFWNWFIGVDRPLAGAREAQLTARFDAVGRRTNDFIAELLDAPEFRQPQRPTPQQARAQSVRAVLQNCVSCHGNEQPDFTAWPIGGSRASMKDWIGRIADSLDFAGDGANRTMPKRSSPWQPTRAEFDLLKNWVRDGAPDDEGAPQI